ncbi:MAG: VCBS repeat-containing protein [Woeseiaceae bacterium]|nr:VCBS repeat-containing protein [Woeseiaceae bacterium]
MNRIQRVAALLIFTCSCLMVTAQADHHKENIIREFQKMELTPVYWSEGGSMGDFNQDGHMDIVVGPDLYLGPNFDRRTGFRHEYYPAVAPTRRSSRDFSYYSNDNFFSFVYDISGDGWPDIMTVGLPNTPAYWYENPGKPFGGKAPQIPVHWEKHFVTKAVKNEAPDFKDLTGDGVPELLMAYDKHYGYVSPSPVSPRLPWIFHPIGTYEEVIHHYTHGMGIGDIDGDGRTDYITGEGWYRQPASLDTGVDWEFNPYEFLNRASNPVFCCLTGGGNMYAYDVNGDGLNDVITSQDAHGWGLSWYEQVRQYGDDGEMITFKEHIIMSKQEENTDNPYGVQFSQLHAVELVDIDGDGLKDILTGKTYRAHDFGDEGSRQAPVIYYFRLTRQDNGKVEYVPYQIDDKAGIGRQLVSGDLNADGLPDFVVGNKNGAFAFIQEARKVSRKEWKKAQPVRIKNFKRK